MICFLAFLSGVFLFQLFDYFPCTVVLLGVVSALYFFRRKKHAAVALLILGLLYPALRNAPDEGLPIRSGNITASGHFRSPAVKLRKGFSQEFQLRDGGSRIDVHSEEEFEIGREHELNLRVITPYERNNPGAMRPGQFAVLGYVRSSGELYSSLSVSFNRLRDRLNKAIAARFEPETASLVMAVTTGHRGDMSYELKEAFRRSGVAHLLSISGTHFGLVFLLLFGAFRAVIKYLPTGILERLTVYLTPSQAAALLCLPFLLLYLGISGMRVPTVRSFIMISLFLFGLLVGRKGRWLNFLVLAAVVLVLWNPGVLRSLSFQLSFLAVLFIGFFLSGKPKAEEDDFGNEDAGKKEKWWRAAIKYPLTSVVITLAATLGVEPLVAYYFHYSSLISPITNLIVTPLVCMVLVPFSIAGSFMYLLTGSFLFEPVVGRVAGASIYLAKALSSVPYSAVPVPGFPLAVVVFYYLGFILYFVTRQGRFLAIAAVSVLIPLIVSASSGKTLDVTFLDAGRGDASVVELPDGKVLVVDTGSRGREVRRYLRQRGLQKIDVLVLTHQDYYHTGGAATLAWQFDVGEVWDNGSIDYPDDFPRGTVRRSLKRGDVIEGDGYTISVLHPSDDIGAGRGGKKNSRNDKSLVLRIKGRESAVLFAGDIGAGAMEELSLLGEELRSDVVKLSDHGRWGRSHAKFIEAVSPSVAVVRGRPDEKVGKYLNGKRVIYSYEEGAARAVESSDGFRIKTFVADVRLKETRSIGEEISNIGKLFSSW